MIGQTLYMSCPDLFTKTFSFDMNSVMAELDSKDAGAGGSVDSEALQKIIDEDLKPAADKLAESITYEKVGKDEFTNANGKTIKADHYTVTITTDAIDEFSQALVDCLNKYMDSNLSDDMMDQMGVTKDQLKQSIGTIPSLVSAVMTKDAVANGASEIDMVINIGWVKDQRWDDLLEEIKAVKQHCEGKLLKVIIETCLLTDEEKETMCDIVCEAGADYIKTSTGFSTAGATFHDVELMVKGVAGRCKVKAAGGISTVEDMEKFLALGADRLGTSRAVKILNGEQAKGY